MTVFYDAEYKCHVINDGTMTAIETDSFDGKCDTYIEGYRIIPAGESWTREDGVVFHGEMITPWKPYTELAATQAGYEKAQADMQVILTEANATIAELDVALLDTTYNYLLMEE